MMCCLLCGMWADVLYVGFCMICVFLYVMCAVVCCVCCCMVCGLLYDMWPVV